MKDATLLLVFSTNAGSAGGGTGGGSDQPGPGGGSKSEIHCVVVSVIIKSNNKIVGDDVGLQVLSNYDYDKLCASAPHGSTWLYRTRTQPSRSRILYVCVFLLSLTACIIIVC